MCKVKKDAHSKYIYLDNKKTSNLLFKWVRIPKTLCVLKRIVTNNLPA